MNCCKKIYVFQCLFAPDAFPGLWSPREPGELQIEPQGASETFPETSRWSFRDPRNHPTITPPRFLLHDSSSMIHKTQDISCLETQDMSCLGKQDMGHPSDTFMGRPCDSKSMIFKCLFEMFGSSLGVSGTCFGIIFASSR